MESRSPSLDALDHAAAAVGDRWTLLIVGALLDGGPLRFGELQERLPGIAPNILSGRLRHLEGAGIVAPEQYSARPPRFSYDLTAAGQDLGSIVRLLSQWGADRTGDDATLRHETCGTPLEARLWCPACDVPVDEDAPVDLV
jgi:DNA-binding HxlR family transcriptional regulator